ncbi:hypothetical protein CYG48_06765 [Neorhizobium sp. SOG26]|uniref:hypothetical protein n=1 Tax=Neorhizobium sp. SOG26 TaxID=2060726 RepID=UPI000E5968EB|nr:hypothetical protein [Neorhizobium sp. SOG26]AXV15424.1 hypothetical protein CYG48_06765 [Neorhizobium sp. SOG26]
MLRHRLPVSVLACSTVLALSACTPERPAPVATNRGALPVMERVALAANACWFKSGDATFKPYRLAPELNSFSGRPRILAVPRNSPESRPMLVVQAEGTPARLDAFGPLMSGPDGERIKRDVMRWAGGDSAC